jgi:hypothetical protein
MTTPLPVSFHPNPNGAAQSFSHAPDPPQLPDGHVRFVSALAGVIG